MMKYNFDLEIPRQGTSSVKWELDPEGQRRSPQDPAEGDPVEKPLLPMWLADMDFACPAPVIEALATRVQNGVYGYTTPGAEFYASVVDWMARRHSWTIEPDWILITPGVVPALNLLVRTFASRGDKVILQPPVYHPFFTAIENNADGWVANPLIYEKGRYRMDFDQLERVAADQHVKMALLCSPHNPVGRVWTADELIRFGEICIGNGVLIVADEIHGDLILQGNRFTAIGTLDREFARQAIICTAPSKTFNMAGLKTSCIIIQDTALRDQFEKTLLGIGMYGANTFGVVALQAAYEHGEEWLEQVLEYLAGNLRLLDDFLRTQLPQIRLVQPEGTYLVWLDCRALGLDDDELRRLIKEEARLLLNDGTMFGIEGSGFQRINIACPRSILQEALQRLKTAVDVM